MSHQVVQQDNPFGRVATTDGLNVGAVSIEQERAIAEAQGQLTLAKRFPRDLLSAHGELMQACKSKSFASVAFYSVPNRGSGPSIRFAEEVARVYGNFQYGHRELSRSEGKSEIEVYAWDMERNNRSVRQLTVIHVQDTRSGPKQLRDQADIDNKIANVASKQVRGRIMALMPKWLIEDAIEACKQTLAGGTDEPIESRVRKMTQAFSRYGITLKAIEKYLGHKLDDVVSDELVDLIGVYNAIREGAKPRDYFPVDDEEDEATVKSLTADTTETAAAKAKAKADADAKAAAEKTAAEKTAADAEAAKAAKAAKAKAAADAKAAQAQAQAQAQAEQAQQAEQAPAEHQSYADAQQGEPAAPGDNGPNLGDDGSVF